MQACKEVWEERKVKDPPTQTLVKLLTLILKCNNFEFNGKHYLQVQGTALGNKMAPAYANIFIGHLEGQLLKSVALRPFSWLRFIDDIDMKWLHGREALTTFLDKANNFHLSKSSRLKFQLSSTCFWTPNQVLWEIQYLLIYIQNQQIHTSISYPQVATRNTAAEMFLTALHFTSDVSALIRTPLNQEQEN